MTRAPRIPQNSTRCCSSTGTAKAEKDDDEDEQVVHRQRLLDDVTGEELERVHRPEPDVDAQVEEHRQRNPHARPDQGLADAHFVGLAMKDARSSTSIATTNPVKQSHSAGVPILSTRMAHLLSGHVSIPVLTRARDGPRRRRPPTTKPCIVRTNASTEAACRGLTCPRCLGVPTPSPTPLAGGSRGSSRSS